MLRPKNGYQPKEEEKEKEEEEEEGGVWVVRRGGESTGRPFIPFLKWKFPTVDRKVSVAHPPMADSHAFICRKIVPNLLGK